MINHLIASTLLVFSLYTYDIYIPASNETLINQDSITIDHSVNEIKVGLSYSGLKIKITGEYPSEADAIILELVSSNNESLSVIKRERKGIIWRIQNIYTIYGMPVIYQYASDIDLHTVIDNYNHWFGAHLIRHNFIQSNSSLNNDLVQEEILESVIHLKTESNLYKLDRIDLKSYGKNLFVANFYLPPAVIDGGCTIKAYKLVSDNLIEYSNSNFTFTISGINDIVLHSSKEHPMIYGLICALLALIIGVGISVIFMPSRR